MREIATPIVSLQLTLSAVQPLSIKLIEILAPARSEGTDERMLSDLAVNDSSVRERAGIVLAYRHQKVGDNLPKPVIVERLRQLRKDSRPWVRQSSLHALVHIEKRKAQLLEEAAAKTDNDNVVD